ncbi:MFS transporter [Caulobacter sp. KR2-114]|uniref:MFS transporter n=1 Tax=Caulobacter sp. KR2-114 TaxID=3400912 RepID=UPI003C113C5A
MADETNYARAQAGVLVAATAGNFVCATPAVQTVFGIFIVPISREFHWPRAEVSGVLTLMAVVTALTYPLLGWATDRWGARRLILPGNLAFAATVAALSLADGRLWQFYALFAVMSVASAVPSTMMFTNVVTGWFDAARGRALGLTAGLGNGAGSTVLPIVAGLLLARYGWRGAYQGIGLLVALIGFPLLLAFLKDPPLRAADQAQAADGLTLAEAARTPTFWITLVAIALGAGCVTAVFTHVAPILGDKGIGERPIIAVISTFALVCAAWQIAVGWLLDRTRAPRIAAPLYLLAAVGVVLMLYAQDTPGLILAGALMGIGLGTEFGALPFFISRYFGLRAYGAISGVMWSPP